MLDLRVDLSQAEQAGDTRATLEEAMVSLLRACPALQSFTSEGHSLGFLHVLHQTCPLLSSLEFVTCDPAPAYLQEVMLLLQYEFPNVHSLELQHTGGSWSPELPDMTENESILSLDLHHFCFTTKAQWLCLPLQLLHLKCFGGIYTGPPTR